jgi:hypothetical protein
MFVALPLAVACADPAQVPDTEEARQEGARTIARLSVESGSLREMIDDGAKLAQASTAESLKLELKRELTDAEEEQVLEIFREALAEILTQKEYEEIMIGVIAAHFSAPEMAEALAFYQSPAGAKILRLESALAQEVDAKTDALFDDHLDDFIARVDRELANEFAELREGDEQ